MTIRSKVSSKEYKDGWDRIFGEMSPQCEGDIVCSVCRDDSDKCVCDEEKELNYALYSSDR